MSAPAPAAPAADDRRVVVTADVGGTFVKSGVLGAAGLPSLRRDPTGRERGSGAVTAELVSTLRRHVDDARHAGFEPIAAGLAVTGTVDEARGVVERAAAFDWHDFAVGDHLAEALGLPVTVSHDVRAGGRAEAGFGAAAGRRTSLFVPVGTGIAAAVVIDGVPLTGATFQAGEIGQHLVADPDEPARLVPLEAVASASAIARRYRAHRGDPTATAADVAAALGRDPLASTIWGDATSALADVLALTIAALDPAIVVLGGGLAGAGSTLAELLVTTLRARLAWRDPPPIELAHFGADAGFVGAALAAWSAATGERATLAAVLGSDWEAHRAAARDRVTPAQRSEDQ